MICCMVHPFCMRHIDGKYRNAIAPLVYFFNKSLRKAPKKGEIQIRQYLIFLCFFSDGGILGEKAL